MDVLSTTGSQTFVCGHRRSVRWSAMSTYRGPVVVIAVDGAETTVTASLQKDHTGTWNGILATAVQDDWTSICNLMQARLRLPDGSEGAFVVPDLPGPFMPATGGRLRVDGNGDAPF